MHNEKVTDLLKDPHDPNQFDLLEVREDPQRGVFVDGLREFAVSSYFDCISLMKLGERNRIVRSTYLNTKSSRSHSVFTIYLEARRGGGDNGR